MINLSPIEKVQAIVVLSKNKKISQYFGQYIADITGNISVLSPRTVVTMCINDLEKLLFRSFLEGVLSKELEIKEDLEKIYEK